MTDLRSRLRTYDSVPVPDLWPVVLSRAETETEAGQPNRWWPAVIATVILVALVGGALLGSGLIPLPGPAETPTPSSSHGPSPSARPSLSPEASQAAGPIAVAWEPVTGLDAGALILGLAFADDRWFALGAVRLSPDDLEPAIWTSTDGRAWSRSVVDVVMESNEYSLVHGLAQIGDDLVAIGSLSAPGSALELGVTWRSTDGGASWIGDRNSPGPVGPLNAITPGGPGLVAVGSKTTDSIDPVDSYAAVSDDGVTWRITGADLTNSLPLDLATLGERIFAVGVAWPTGDNVLVPAAWYSDNGGETWSEAAMPAPGYPLEVVPSDGGLVAIGYGDGAIAWLTDDGETWERVEVAPSAQGSAIAAVDGGLAAVGNEIGSGGELGPGRTWTSADARDWLQGPELGDGSVNLQAAVGNGSTVLAAGPCLAASCPVVLWRGEVMR